MRTMIVFSLMLFTFGVFAADLPDPKLTPGAIRMVSVEQVCKKGSSKAARAVPNAEKKQVYAVYGLKGNHTGYCAGKQGCEIDHLISLELGGSNDAKNLWPQSYEGHWNAHVKDKLENELHKKVCAGKLSLATAQTKIAHNWIGLYCEEFKRDPLCRSK